ncbi:hypothetical protein LXM94_01860 [Rhizobium sp. TRM95111]|uniref:hypothetical protein n=1 Tax=Rhizobium alarense TaxID=2846851 RepID=UPI001F207D16|nr:hypothetical protein [Rhizobium alarense]MCF3638716.1 hypothetical protein [Rhizobium alarense]
MKNETGQKKTERLHMLISPDELEAIDEWRFANRVGTRADAVRRLCDRGLKFDERFYGLAAVLYQSLFDLESYIAASQDTANDAALNQVSKDLLVGALVGLGLSHSFDDLVSQLEEQNLVSKGAQPTEIVPAFIKAYGDLLQSTPVPYPPYIDEESL